MEESSVVSRWHTSTSARRLILGSSVLLLLGSCSANPTALTIVKDVKPLGAIRIPQICIELNVKDDDGMATDLFKAVEALGFNTLAKQAAFRGECQYSLSYKVSWAGYIPKWPLAIDVTVYDGRSQIGFIRYDASRGSNRPDRYGSAIGKLKPLLTELFAEVDR
ncbi:MAG: hypothetical protein E2O61_12645 [Gammaproteobacteria bacterium]|nr:MAG: hypothetical protein E2O59_09130 [Gammaproteobacteria bacterium]TDJ33254.1 MAG: hypothetical protein E2O61_12645 [Gammaproteobacteria bacterium]